jgi:hypothetical protein
MLLSADLLEDASEGSQLISAPRFDVYLCIRGRSGVQTFARLACRKVLLASLALP